MGAKDFIEKYNNKIVNILIEAAEEVRGKSSELYVDVGGTSGGAYLGPDKLVLSYTQGRQTFPDPHKYTIVSFETIENQIAEILNLNYSASLDLYQTHVYTLIKLSKGKALTLEQMAQKEGVPAKELERILEEHKVTGINLYYFRSGKAVPHLSEKELQKIMSKMAKSKAKHERV
jgi:anaerobic selenocysteine-containing dehydrogenase